MPLDIQGTFVSTYAADVVGDDPLTPATNPPDMFEAYVAQSTIVILAFANGGSLKGAIHRNFGGVSSAIRSIPCRGSYLLEKNVDLDVYEGTISLDLLRSDGSKIRTQILYVVRKNDDAFIFMLSDSIVYGQLPSIPPRDVTPPTVPIPLPALAVVQGTFERVTPAR